MPFFVREIKMFENILHFLQFNDKAIHFIYALTIFFIIHLFFGWQVAIGTVIVATIGKEIYDHISPFHDFDLKDIVSSLAGGFFGLFLVYLKSLL